MAAILAYIAAERLGIYVHKSVVAEILKVSIHDKRHGVAPKAVFARGRGGKGASKRGAMTRAFVAACGKWVEVDVEGVRVAAKAGAVFEAVIAPVVKDCAWGEVERGDGVLAGFNTGIAEQYIVRHYGGVEEAWLVIDTDEETAEKAVEGARKRGYEVVEKSHETWEEP
ncbi:MAG: hypothetical protein QXS00_01170 [Pyrobaculum sp.]|uniref:hypothetical protein n=1 Tax=Pyrobaculum sp. TaxID=2004705 RepID=UPI00317DC046